MHINFTEKNNIGQTPPGFDQKYFGDEAHFSLNGFANKRNTGQQKTEPFVN